jgi:predicted choloylglycine hydrolase
LTVAATITDEFTDGYIQSVFQTLTDKFTNGMYLSVNHDKNPSVYFKRETFFWRANSVCKTIGKFFFVFPTDIAMECGITDEGKANGHNLSVKTLVNKSPTNW